MSKLIKEYELKNKIKSVQYCVISLFDDGKILLNWHGEIQGSKISETGYFLSIRAAKMYVSKKISSGREKWKEIVI